MIKKSLCLVSVVAALALSPSNMEARAAIKQFNQQQESIFEFLADDMEYNKTQIIGKGHVTIINLDYFVTANKAIYDTQKQEILLSGNVNAYKGNSLYLKSQEVKIRLQEDYSFLEPFYLQDSESGLWVDSKSAEFNNNIYQTKETNISTCSVNNPIWTIKAKEGEYDANDEWLTVWHPRLCIYDVPVLYFPYLSFSLGYKRKTGLLYPLVGNSSDDGFFYSQPIFIAPDDNWDMTFMPQIRTKRGGGFYNEFRMIDDQDKILWVNLGYFGNSRSYQQTYDLENRDHYGIQLQYERENLFSKPENYFYEDGLYVDISQISDIDYFRLQEEDAQNIADLQGNLLTSRLNYYLKSSEDYLGFSARYYSDLEQTSNANTLQTLPEIQYHRQIDNILLDNLYYSFDYKASNFTRPVGYRAIQQEAELPIIYTQSLLNDFLNVSLSPIFYGTSVDYSNKQQDLNLNNGRYFSQYYRFKANTDLVKKYDSFGHTISLEAEYTLPGFEHKEGDFTSFFTLPGDRQEFKLGGTQYFYTLDNSLILSHKMEQYFYFEDNDNKLGELENEIQYFYNNQWSFVSDIFYSHKEARISEATHQVNYESDYIKASFGHFVRESFAKEDWINGRFGEANYINVGFRKEFENFDVFANAGYDYREKYFKTWQVGVDMQIRCFSFGVKYVSEIYPMLTSRGAEARDDKYILFTIQFIPLLSSDLKMGS
ncbi:LPS-assembly protein LptD [Helicobacter pullorum]|uniref:LPS-assembly protein LptD n=1 Tax=Helicobacter pullorum TaxID=35818 RepID=UPI0006CD00CD|nr:LPS assembly protein LptD [Helicobacter pullorum]KPH54519.1 membrane protein [Helicobacter pullorum]